MTASDFERDEYNMSELRRVNEEVKRVTGTYLVDLDLISKYQKVKQTPEEYRTDQIASEADGRQHIIDIFRKKTVVIPDGEDADEFTRKYNEGLQEEMMKYGGISVSKSPPPPPQPEIPFLE